MADNVDITPGAGATVAADDVGGVLFQRVKLTAGANGVAADLSTVNIDDLGGDDKVGLVVAPHLAGGWGTIVGGGSAHSYTSGESIGGKVDFSIASWNGDFLRLATIHGVDATDTKPTLDIFVVAGTFSPTINDAAAWTPSGADLYGPNSVNVVHVDTGDWVTIGSRAVFTAQPDLIIPGMNSAGNLYFVVVTRSAITLSGGGDQFSVSCALVRG